MVSPDQGVDQNHYLRLGVLAAAGLASRFASSHFVCETKLVKKPLLDLEK